MSARLTKRQQKIIQQVGEMATMQGFSGRDNMVKPDQNSQYRTDQTIQEFTRIWRESWILEPLRNLLREAGVEPAF